ncbi:localizes primarily to the nucleolus [Aspergillus japonicus CBS 114.51]|uniref:Localizes primarily to the nucleolus n=2 Tax=Aspergillus TaxID=5052 RepID=A0A2V5H729_ASPV1|nr:localizes primarily to the nucleolus [Aspergillus japonicus CBS 114.51]PYI20048.1 localizes primarily to the nucleolus [Aspergillus violaceofuscus CBS 115571]RAH86952.1 localizes primarily to the nucleolus [Aspergillus japonicus CBS 114.51]
MAAAVSQPAPSGLQNVSALLETLTTCLNNTGSSLPKATRENPSDVSIEPPQDGISLLDTKSDLLLSYLQNLVFLIIFQLRGLKKDEEEDEEVDESLPEEIVKKLVELRVYLDRGVRPLEGRLKYQVDKVIKAAEDAERAERDGVSTGKSKKAKGSDAEESGSEGSSDSEGDSDEEDEEEGEGADIDEMAYRPNVSAFSKRAEPQARPDKLNNEPAGDGIYRPPRIMPTALPTTERKERRERPAQRSNVIDEFVSAEMSSAPMAEPSIGSTIVQGGRHTKSKKEREREAERTAYEETNFVRLMKESKKDRAKRLRAEGPQNQYGGEDWRDLTAGADRITKLTRRAKGSGGALDKSRKRKVTEDGQRDDGVGVGQIFEKRRKKVDSWKR